jgi:hypothetical protein
MGHDNFAYHLSGFIALNSSNMPKKGSKTIKAVERKAGLFVLLDNSLSITSSFVLFMHQKSKDLRLYLSWY